MVAMDLGSPPLPKKSLPLPGPLEQVANRLSSKVAAEVPHGSKQELPDLKGEWSSWQGGVAGQAGCWPGWSHRELLGLGVNVGPQVGHSSLSSTPRHQGGTQLSSLLSCCCPGYTWP